MEKVELQKGNFETLRLDKSGEDMESTAVSTYRYLKGGMYGPSVYHVIESKFIEVSYVCVLDHFKLLETLPQCTYPPEHHVHPSRVKRLSSTKIPLQRMATHIQTHGMTRPLFSI